MLTIEIAIVLLLLLGLVIFAIVRAVRGRGGAKLPEPARESATILVVDDDPDFVKITRRVLENHGYDVESSSSGAEALKTMRDAETKPDLVLLDIMMDYITDGLDVSNAMQRDPQLKDIPVVMVTSLTGVKSQELFPSDQRVAVEGWLSKPVRPETLIKAVDKALTGEREGVPVSAPAMP
jgi:CheY-like chemotaxis protein